MRIWWALWNVCFVIGIDDSWRGRYAPKLAGLTFDMECNCDCPLPETHELLSAPHKYSMPPWGGLHRSALHDLIWVCILRVQEVLPPLPYIVLTYPSDFYVRGLLVSQSHKTFAFQRLAKFRRRGFLIEHTSCVFDTHESEKTLVCVGSRICESVCQWRVFLVPFK